MMYLELNHWIFALQTKPVTRCVKQQLPSSLPPTLLEFYLIALAAITFALLLQTCILILRQDLEGYFFSLRMRNTSSVQNPTKGWLGSSSVFSFLFASLVTKVSIFCH